MPASLSQAASVVTRKTRLGWLAVVTRPDTATSNDILLAVTFAHETPQAALRGLPESVLDSEATSAVPTDGRIGINISSKTTPLVRRLQKFLGGQPDGLLDVQIDESWCTPFQRAVIHAVRSIPLGETRTYGQIASLAGSPRAARAVGTVMAQNRTPLVVPCHRVVASGGMGGFSARGGLRTKLRLLETESATKSGRRRAPRQPR